MAHDATKVLMGTRKSTFATIDNKAGTLAAGLFGRLKSDDTISTTKADGTLYGVSLGRDLSGTARTAYVRRGKGVPVKLAAGQTPTIGGQVFVDDANGEAKTSASSATGCNALFASEKLTGIQEDGTSIDVAFIDFPGGL